LLKYLNVIGSVFEQSVQVYISPLMSAGIFITAHVYDVIERARSSFKE